MADDIIRYWNQRKKHNQTVRELGRVEITHISSRLQVVAPYDVRFVAWSRKHGGRWRYRSQMWSFPDYMESQVVSVLHEIYGADVIITHK